MRTPKQPGGGSGLSTRPSVPRTWLLLLVAAFVGPWLIAGVLYVRAGAAAGGAPDAPEPAIASARDPGPWGILRATPIIVSPPLEYVASDWGRPTDAHAWHFPGVAADMARDGLISFGLQPTAAAALLANARHEPAIRGVIAVPDPAIVRSMSPEVRARVYRQLGRSALNFDQAHAFRFLGRDAAEWFDGSSMSARTRALVEPLVYRDGAFLHFADAELVRREIGDEEELRRLAKTLLRQSTLLLTLSVPSADAVPHLAEYWGRGGRRTDIRPLLESIAGTGQSIDVVHLLPAFARNRLYRYPRVTTADYEKPLLANCLWSSLNFFADEPDDRYLDVETSLQTLRTGYHVVQSGYQLGDVVGFVDAEGDLFHAAVYLADGLLLTKNGTSPVAPWTIMSIEHVSGYYGRVDAQRLIVHRRNGL